MINALFGILFGVGVFMLCADLLKIPHIKTSKTLAALSKRQKKKTGSVELWLRGLADWTARHIRLNEYKRLQLESDLKSAEMNISPELHTANAMVKAGLIGLLAIPAWFIFPLAVPLVLMLAAAVYMKELKGVSEKICAKRDAIEYELPRLVFTVEKTLMHSRDVLTLLDAYRENAGPELKSELLVTVADMRSGNYEAALTRLEARVGSSMLSDVTRGLIGILRGDDTAVYWSTLSVKFADVQRQILKKKAMKAPAKVRRLSMALLFCFMAVYLVVIVTEILTSLGAMF
ncbi:MAG: secretion protein F [Eubacteriales bacterium]|nr:secretion protein F [Eubacteriales bacterium]